MKIATVASVPTPSAEVAVRRAFLCARVAADYKAQDVVVLDMRGITPLYDFLVLATGTSRRQIHTLAEEIDAAMAAEGETRLGIEGYASAGTLDEQWLHSRERATKVRDYLVKKFTLSPDYVGVMPMGTVVGYGDGVALVLLKK